MTTATQEIQAALAEAENTLKAETDPAQIAALAARVVELKGQLADLDAPAAAPKAAPAPAPKAAAPAAPKPAPAPAPKAAAPAASKAAPVAPKAAPAAPKAAPVAPTAGELQQAALLRAMHPSKLPVALRPTRN